MKNKIPDDDDLKVDIVRSFYIGVPSLMVRYLFLQTYVHHQRVAIGYWKAVEIFVNVYDGDCCGDYYDGDRGWQTMVLVQDVMKSRCVH